MTSVDPSTTQPAHGSRFFTAGCVIAMLTGVAHSLSHVAPRPKPTSADGAELVRLLTTYTMPQIGRTTEELLLGFSWWFALGLFAPALIALVIRRGRTSDASLLRTLSVSHIMLLGAGLAISLRYFFYIPSTLIGAALACHATALACAIGTRR